MPVIKINKVQIIIVFIFCIVLGGCATLTLEQCQTSNWQQKGYKDGSNGSGTRIAKYQKQCSEHNVSVPSEAYYVGYQEGLKVFCTYDNGVREGEAGRRNEGVCVGGAASEFNKGHTAGYKVYQLREELEEQKKAAEELAEKNEDARKQSEKDAIESLEQCHFDSDCGQGMECASKTVTIGSTSDSINQCVAK